LSRTPIVCPVCQTAYQVTPPAPRRGGERAQVVKPAPEPEADQPVLGSADVISLEEAEEAGAEVPIEDEEEIVDIGDEDAADIPAGDDDTFLEEEEESEADVSGIVGGGPNEEQ
jgi:hypothetical protein